MSSEDLEGYRWEELWLLSTWDQLIFSTSSDNIPMVFNDDDKN